MAVYSLAIYAIALRTRLPRAAIEEHVGDFTAEAKEVEAELPAVAYPARPYLAFTAPSASWIHAAGMRQRRRRRRSPAVPRGDRARRPRAA